MHVLLDHEQTEILREILDSTLKQVRVESAHTDSREFREMLHRREAVIESMLAKLFEDPAQIAI